MRFVSTRELRINPSKVLDALTSRGVVITRHGKPAAALLPLSDDDIEDFVLAHHPAFRKEVQAAVREYDDKGGVDLDTMERTIREHSARRSTRSRRTVGRDRA